MLTERSPQQPPPPIDLKHYRHFVMPPEVIQAHEIKLMGRLRRLEMAVFDGHLSKAEAKRRGERYLLAAKTGILDTVDNYITGLGGKPLDQQDKELQDTLVEGVEAWNNIVDDM